MKRDVAPIDQISKLLHDGYIEVDNSVLHLTYGNISELAVDTDVDHIIR